MAPEIKYTKLFINNEWVDAKNGRTFETYNPANGSVIGKIARGDKEDIDLAVEAASRAFHRHSEWRTMDASKRGQIINRFADLLVRDSDYIAELESYNNGMLLKFAKRAYAVLDQRVRYLASLADKIQGDTIPADGEVFSYTLKEPVGVCGLILAWNGPVRIFLTKVITALTAGCTVVVKPAEQTPLTALYLGSLLKEAGIPPGVVNIVTGFGEDAGSALSHHPNVAKISFTGSVEVGKKIQEASGKTNLKRLTLELGGKSPLIIMNDANLDEAVPFAGNAVFFHQGQVCVAASRLFVQSKIYDEFVKRAIKYAEGLTIGSPDDTSTDHGPQIDATQGDIIMSYIILGVKEGAKLMTGGKRVQRPGYYIEPTVFADVKDDMTIAKEEIFGPVQSILKFDTLEEVIERANNTSYGLAAAIFTNDIKTAIYFGKHVEAGVVGINMYHNFASQLPFGGFKQSGIGREGGIDAVEEYLEVKTVSVALPNKLY